MTLKFTARLALLSTFIYSVPTIATDDQFAGKTYQDGFGEGISFAIAALAYKTYGMDKTPHPVEMPINEGWVKTEKTRTTIHLCVRKHVARDLAKAGGATNMLYFSITSIAKEVLAYCGAEKTQAP